MRPCRAVRPFLENFLVDARACWAEGGEKRVRSGPWTEQTTDGKELSLEATALTAGGQQILLLERLGEVFEAKKSMLQKARETVIAYQRLNSEMQKKEILLNCISEEMNAALANVITSLRLIELEKDPARIATTPEPRLPRDRGTTDADQQSAERFRRRVGRTSRTQRGGDCRNEIERRHSRRRGKCRLPVRGQGRALETGRERAG